MSNFIVAKGLGGPLLVTAGWGAGSNIPTGPCILKSSIGGLRVFIKKAAPFVNVTLWDGHTQLLASLPATAEQLAGNDWMIIKITRQLISEVWYFSFTLDKNDPVFVPAGTIYTYGGNFTFMDAASGGLFDPRIIPAAISKEASDYYYDDIYENAGKALLPNG